LILEQIGEYGNLKYKCFTVFHSGMISRRMCQKTVGLIMKHIG